MRELLPDKSAASKARTKFKEGSMKILIILLALAMAGCSSQGSGYGVDPEDVDGKGAKSRSPWNQHATACSTPELRERNKNFCEGES